MQTVKIIQALKIVTIIPISNTYARKLSCKNKLTIKFVAISLHQEKFNFLLDTTYFP